MNPLRLVFVLMGIAVLLPLQSFAQFTVDGQIIVRSEFRNGYNRPMAEGLDPAGFIAHRARLQAGYKMDRFDFYMSIQDVRTWGSTSQANVTDGLLSLHEAYGEVSFGENWKVKLGRQELNYDNFRFLGNLDWALQARSHDFALVKLEKEKSKLHFGGGFNQDGQALSGNIYNVPNQYRTAQLVRFESVLDKVDYTLLFWNEGRQWTQKDANGAVVDKGVRFRQTLGIPMVRTTIKNTTLSGYFYSQFGEDVNGNTVSAFNTSAQVSQLFVNTEDGKKWRATLGAELISGTDAAGSDKNSSYSLQYGTNHLFNGYIDWFFVSNTWENSVGLKDFYLRSRYEFNPRFWLQADVHSFSSYADTALPGENADSKSKNLGSELDLTFGWIIHEAVSLQGGYSQYFLSDTMRSLNAQSLSSQQNWAYLMVVFRPTSKAKFIGVLQ